MGTFWLHWTCKCGRQWTTTTTSVQGDREETKDVPLCEACCAHATEDEHQAGAGKG